MLLRHCAKQAFPSVGAFYLWLCIFKLPDGSFETLLPDQLRGAEGCDLQAAQQHEAVPHPPGGVRRPQLLQGLGGELPGLGRGDSGSRMIWTGDVSPCQSPSPAWHSPGSRTPGRCPRPRTASSRPWCGPACGVVQQYSALQYSTVQCRVLTFSPLIMEIFCQLQID